MKSEIPYLKCAIFSQFQLNNFVVFSFPGLVSKSSCQISEAREHQERSRPSGPQRTTPNLFRRAHFSRGAGAKGERPTGEKDVEAVGEAAEEVGGEGDPRRSGDVAQGLRDATRSGRQDQLQQSLRGRRFGHERHGDRRRRGRRLRHLRRRERGRPPAQEVPRPSGKLCRRQSQEDVGIQHRKSSLFLTRLTLFSTTNCRRRLQRCRR